MNKDGTKSIQFDVKMILSSKEKMPNDIDVREVLGRLNPSRFFIAAPSFSVGVEINLDQNES